MNARRVTIYLYQWQIDWLKEKAKDAGLPVSHFVANIITAKIEAERKAKESNERLRAVLDKYYSTPPKNNKQLFSEA